jgi:N6-L-threonylcarbamoyladenine synthase
MYVLGVESSCDESAISILKITDRVEIIFEAISSQIDLHAQYGGVVPELAAREHLKNLPLLFNKAQQELDSRSIKLDLIAATRGPGLKGCLLIGYEFAKGLALGRNIDLIGVNHIEAHIHAAKLSSADLTFPFLALVVSGGHTELVYVQDLGVYQIIARTQDDAAGEAFDKSANLLGFEYPGGAALAKLADSCSSSTFNLPKVMRESEGFSFSGLKTAISLLIKKNNDLLSQEGARAELAHAIQESIVDALVYKTKKAAADLNIKSITATGGVACNRRLRERLLNEFDLPVVFPEPKHCVDNASMVALVGAERFRKFGGGLYHQEVLARWPVESMGADNNA